MRVFALLILISPELWAFNKDFVLVNDRAPLEFKLLFESLKYSLKQTQEQLRLVVLAQHINKGLGPLKKDQSFFMLKSEIYKSLLDWPHPPSQFQVGAHTLIRLKSKLENNRAINTPFSNWVLEALIADLENFEAQGVLSLSPSERANLIGEKAQQNLKLQRVLKFSKGWIEQADTLSAQDFNQLTEQLAWKTLERVKSQASLFRRFSSQAIQDSFVDTFNIPDQAMPRAQGPEMTDSTTPKEESLSEKAENEKREAEEALSKIKSEAQTPPAEELSGAIDQVETETPGGTAPTPNTIPSVNLGNQTEGVPGDAQTLPAPKPPVLDAPLE